jgi:hypothetical protein
MVATVEVLAGEMAEAYDELKRTLSGLTDPEFAWEPVAGSWRVFRDDDCRWTYDYAIPDLQPVHLALCKVVYHEWASGPRELTWNSIEPRATSKLRSRRSNAATDSWQTISHR